MSKAKAATQAKSTSARQVGGLLSPTKFSAFSFFCIQGNWLIAIGLIKDNHY
jgi:hypothetical protein